MSPGVTSSEVPADFYSKAVEYWNNVDPTIGGMLGGLQRVHNPDIAGSEALLARFGPARCERAIDCGAGIGRITKHLLLPRFTIVDMVEMTRKFLDASVEYIGEEEEEEAEASHRVGERFCSALQDFTPAEGVYDLIWVQWVIGYLTVPASIEFFRRCAKALRPPDSDTSRRSVIVLKDNVTTNERADFDEVDSSFMRTHEELLEIFRKAELKVLLDEIQTNMPKDICPVYAFVLIPNEE